MTVHSGGPGDGVPPIDASTLTDEAIGDEIQADRRAERRLLVVVALIATACTVVTLLLHGPIS